MHVMHLKKNKKKEGSQNYLKKSIKIDSDSQL